MPQKGLQRDWPQDRRGPLLSCRWRGGACNKHRRHIEVHIECSRSHREPKKFSVFGSKPGFGDAGEVYQYATVALIRRSKKEGRAGKLSCRRFPTRPLARDYFASRAAVSPPHSAPDRPFFWVNRRENRRIPINLRFSRRCSPLLSSGPAKCSVRPSKLGRLAGLPL